MGTWISDITWNNHCFQLIIIYHVLTGHNICWRINLLPKSKYNLTFSGDISQCLTLTVCHVSYYMQCCDGNHSILYEARYDHWNTLNSFTTTLHLLYWYFLQITLSDTYIHIHIINIQSILYGPRYDQTGIHSTFTMTLHVLHRYFSKQYWLLFVDHKEIWHLFWIRA